MKVYIGIILLLLGLSVKGQTNNDRSNLFDFDWRFHLGGAQGADQPTFDDSAWRMLDLPHDWSIEDRAGTGSPFNRDAIGQVSAGFTTGGTGWYRKSFTIPLNQKGKQFLIQFDGVYER
jgi:beta-galactosidase